VVPEKQDIHPHHSGDQGEHIKRDRHVSSHPFILSVLSAVGFQAEGRSDARASSS
jgi:hypothetical protein